MTAKQHPFIKQLRSILVSDDPKCAYTYTMNWYVKNPEDVDHNLASGSVNVRMKQSERNTKIDKVLLAIKKKHKLPSTEVINFSIRRKR
jgi:hypothetical protein